MGSGRTIGVLGTAAVLVCLAGSLRAAASDGMFTIRTKVARPPARMEWTAGYPVKNAVAKSAVTPAGWEITVGFDAVRCEVVCSYRQKRPTALLLPPVVSIQVYSDSIRKPDSVVLDPAGLAQPGMANLAIPMDETVALPGRWAAAGLAGDCGAESVPIAAERREQPHSAPSAVSPSLPLRI